MRKSKKINSVAVIAIGAFFLCASALAAPQTEKTYPNITEGHLGMSGSISVDSTTVGSGNAATTFRLSTATRYFFIDYLALGITLRLVTSSGTTNVEVGPNLQWYFWRSDRLGAYFSQDFLLRALSTSGFSASTSELTSAVGLNYFLYPSVAVGPSVQYFHLFGTNSYSKIDQISFSGQFSIYL